MNKRIIALFTIVFLTTAVRSYAQPNEVCFCHNAINNPVTICTSDAGLINGHTAHVINGSDSLGQCPGPTVTSTPTNTPTNTPTLTPTNTPTSTPSNTPTPTDGPISTPTNTPTPTSAPLCAPVDQGISALSFGGTAITVINRNNLCAVQTNIATNTTGNNKTSGNVGSGGIYTGAAGSATNMAIGGNTNSTVISGFTRAVRNVANIINTGANAFINASAN